MTINVEPSVVLSKTVQGAIKQFLAEDQAQSGNHCLKCALSRAEAHLKAVLDTTTTMVDVSRHSHRVTRERPIGEGVQDAKP